MAVLKTAAFQALLDGDIANIVSDDRQGVAIRHEFNVPTAIAAADTVILGYVGGRYVMPELGSFTADGVGTALTLTIGTGIYDATANTHTIIDADDVMLSTNAAALLHQGLAPATGAQPAGVATRIAPAQNKVIFATVSAETGGELTGCILDLPFSLSSAD